jgi:hypothetical protein
MEIDLAKTIVQSREKTRFLQQQTKKQMTATGGLLEGTFLFLFSVSFFSSVVVVRLSRGLCGLLSWNFKTLYA